MQAGGCLTRGSLRAILLRIVLLKGLVVHALPTAAAVLIASLVCQGAALSQESYPSKPLRIIVPYAAGGGIDILGRTIGQQLAERWKQPAVVDNKPGVSGAIGT